MNQQETFDVVTAHLFTQGRRAVNGNACQYLTDDGRKCAVGILIPDGHPAQASSGDVDLLLSDHIDLWDIIVPSGDDEDHGKYLLRKLQEIHDDRHNWNGGFVGWDWLRAVADGFHFDTTVVDALEAVTK